MHLDIHSHFLSMDFVMHMIGRSELPTTVLEGGEYSIECGGELRFDASARIVDMDTKLKDLEAMGVDLSVLSHGIPGPEVLAPDEADYWASKINDHLASIIEAYPGKFLGWGTIGFGDPQRSVAELERCVNELGFKGMQLYANIGGRVVDSPEFWPVYRRAAELGVALNLHPTIPLNRNGMDTRSLLSGLGFMYDTSLATMRLFDSGLFDELPTLKFILPHVGGVLPYLRGRVDRQRVGKPRPVSDYFDLIYFDTVSYNMESLDLCYKWIGPERMLYGTDHPFTPPTRFIADMVEGLGCTPEELEMIFHGNAERLLGIG